METRLNVHFSPLSNAVYEWVEWMWRMKWMWRMSEQSGVDLENEQVERSGCGE